MNILMIYDGEYPWDVRIEKFCNTFLKFGYTITLICRNYNGDPLNEKINGINIVRLPFIKERKSFLNVFCSFPLFFHPLWIFTIYKNIKNNNYDIIFVRDLPLALTGVFASLVFKISLILDMAEPYPETLRQILKFEKNKILNFIVRNPFLADIIERISLKFVHHVFVVSQESKDRLIFMGYPERKITIIWNTPTKFLENRSNNCLNRKLNHEYLRKSFTLLYVGILIPGRGVDIAINSISILRKKDLNIQLKIIGDGTDRNKLLKLTNDLDLNNIVDFVGWVEHDKIYEHIIECDVGLLPFSDSGHHNITIANKFFDFLAYKKPIICSDLLPMRRLITEFECGVTFNPDDSVDLANVVEICYYNEKLHQFGMNGHHFVRDIFNWKNNEPKINSTINNLLKVS